MPLPVDARTGFDYELQVRDTFFQHLIQLLMDTGVVPASIPIPSILNPGETVDVFLKASLAAVINRTYESNSGFAYPEEANDEINEAFTVSFFEYPEIETVKDFIYLSVRVVSTGGIKIDLIGRISKTIDVQALAAAFVTYDPEDPDSSPPQLTSFFNLEAIHVGEDVGFDPENPTSEMVEQVIPELENIQDIISNLGKAIAGEERGYEGILDFMISQADPLGLARIDTIYLSCIDSQQLALMGNLILLSRIRAFVPARGNLANFESILPDGQDIAFATGPQLLPNIVADILTKLNLIVIDENEGLSAAELDQRLLAERFPLRIEDDLLREWLGMELDEDDQDQDLAISAYVNDIITDTGERSFNDNDGNNMSGNSLRCKIKCNGYLADLIGLASANLLLDVYPFTDSLNGKTVSNLTLHTNARADIWRSLSTVTGIIPTLIGAVVDIFTNADEITIPLSSLADLPLVDIPIVKKRWDPFYTTLHTLLFEVDEHTFESNRFGFSAIVNLSKRFDPFYNIYLRDIDQVTNQSDRLRFRVELQNRILTQTLYATDREPFFHEEDDIENGIYSLSADEGNGRPVSRIDANKFYGFKNYSPYCVNQDKEGSRIAAIGLLSDEEENDLYRHLEWTFVNDKVNEFVAGIESIINRELTEEELKEMTEAIRPIFEDSGELSDYLENDIDDDFLQSVYSPGKIRLKPDPDTLLRLINRGVLQLWGYEPIVREGELYFRGKADRTEENNLLSLPGCPVIND